MRILVTGGRGFVGSEVVRKLNRAGIEPVVTSRAAHDGPEVAGRSVTVGGLGEVGAYQGISRPTKYGRTTQENVRINGVTENIPRIGAPRELEAGRHLVAEDVEQARNVAVIGTDLVEAFFGSMEPLGREVLLDGRPFKVVGVAEKKGSVFGERQDNFVWMPITTFRKLYGTRRSVIIQAEARSMAQFEPAQDQVRVAIGPGAI